MTTAQATRANHRVQKPFSILRAIYMANPEAPEWELETLFNEALANPGPMMIEFLRHDSFLLGMQQLKAMEGEEAAKAKAEEEATKRTAAAEAAAQRRMELAASLERRKEEREARFKRGEEEIVRRIISLANGLLLETQTPLGRLGDLTGRQAVLLGSWMGEIGQGIGANDIVRNRLSNQDVEQILRRRLRVG